MTEQMKKMPLVSCITPFLNGEKFIEEAIESVLAQTYENCELLLVDDGSTDKSTEIALRYAQQYPEKVRYLEHEGHQNRGKSASRNLGIQNAKGDYIAFLDADDIWLPQKLEKQVAILAAHPEAGMVFGAHNQWFSWTGNPEDINRDTEVIPLWDSDIEPDTLVQPPKLLTQYLQNRVCTPLTCGVLIKREVVEDIGGFDEAIPYLNEDSPFFAKIYLKVPVFIESGCWDKYRQHPDSTVAVARAKGEWFDEQVPQPVHLAEMNVLEKYLVEQGVTDTEIWKAINAQLFPYRHPYLYRLQQIARQINRLARLTLRKILPTSIRQALSRRLA